VKMTVEDTGVEREVDGLVLHVWRVTDPGLEGALLLSLLVTTRDEATLRKFLEKGWPCTLKHKSLEEPGASAAYLREIHLDAK